MKQINFFGRWGSDIKYLMGLWIRLWNAFSYWNITWVKKVILIQFFLYNFIGVFLILLFLDWCETRKSYKIRLYVCVFWFLSEMVFFWYFAWIVKFCGGRKLMMLDFLKKNLIGLILDRKGQKWPQKCFYFYFLKIFIIRFF